MDQGSTETSSDAPGTPSPFVLRRSSASAPAKLILCGEHAVVYGRPAIALPLAGIRARVSVADAQPGSGIAVSARDLGRRWRVRDDPGNPLSELIANTLEQLELPAGSPPDLKITIRSSIPIASGMGSGAAVATALVRALAAHFDRALHPAAISALVYASERRFHGTPSGIDNTVIAYEQPIWFVRQPPAEEDSAAIGDRSPSTASIAPAIEPIVIAAPFTLLIGDTGVRSATSGPVGEVRRRWQERPERYESLFDQVGALILRARELLASGDVGALGSLLSENHLLLQQIGVSSPGLDALVGAARAAGALGAKLSGAGWGGIMLALVTPDTSERVAAALARAGAARVIETAVDQAAPTSS